MNENSNRSSRDCGGEYPVAWRGSAPEVQPPSNGITPLAAGRPVNLSDAETPILRTLRLSAVLQAFQHASKGELRELIALDAPPCEGSALYPVDPIRHARALDELRRLAPVRHERLLARYRAAVESGQAHGHPAVVAGVNMAVFSVALRQGLLDYAWRELGGAMVAREAASMAQPEAPAQDGSTDLSAVRQEIERLVREEAEPPAGSGGQIAPHYRVV